MELTSCRILAVGDHQIPDGCVTLAIRKLDNMLVPAGSGKSVGSEFVPHGVVSSGETRMFETPEALAKHLGVTELPEAVLGISNSIKMVDTAMNEPDVATVVIPAATTDPAVRRVRRRNSVAVQPSTSVAVVSTATEAVVRQDVAAQVDTIQAPQQQVYVSLDSRATMGVGFGTMRVAFHDVIVTDDLIVLRYDQRHTTSVQWMPPGEVRSPVGLRLRLASDGPDACVYHVVSGGLIFEEDGYMAVVVLLRVSDDPDDRQDLDEELAGAGTLVSGLPPEI